MGITLAAFQFSSSVAALNDKLHIFVSSKATSFDRAFILLGRVPSSWWFITMQFFELFHHSPSLMFLSISPSTIAKGNPSSAMILRINGKLGYFPIKRVGWPRPNVLPLTITERVGNGGPGEPPAQPPPPEPQAPVQERSAEAMLQGSRGTSQSWRWGEAGSRWKNWPITPQSDFPQAPKVLFLLLILDSRNLFFFFSLFSLTKCDYLWIFNFEPILCNLYIINHF